MSKLIIPNKLLAEQSFINDKLLDADIDALCGCLQHQKISLKFKLRNNTALHLIKIYLTSSNGPRRLLIDDNGNGSYTLILYRKKNDIIGKNISPKNLAAVKQIEKNYNIAIHSYLNNDFTVIDI